MDRAKLGSIAGALTAGAGIVLATVSLASTLPVSEVGNTRASATNVDFYFTLDSDPNIFDSTVVPHASVSSTNDATTDVDWYSFTGTDGAAVFIDIDCGYGCGVSFNPLLALFDSSGTMIAFDNDANPADPGSAAAQDPFIGRFSLPDTPTGSATYYVSVSNGYPNAACNNYIQLQRPYGGFGGWEVEDCQAGIDSFSAGGDSTGNYLLHISHFGSASIEGPNYGNQLSDQPKYRWLDLPEPNPFQLEYVPSPALQSGAGTCQMTLPSPSTCSSLGSQPGCILVAYNFPPSPPANGFECCGWQGKCELTCQINACTGGEPVSCPPACGGSPPSQDSYCWNSNLGNCANTGNQAACDLEEQRLRALDDPAVPECCFLGTGSRVLRWGDRASEEPINPDGDVFPNQCSDNCPQVANDTQADTDGDQRGDACDSFPNHRYQCADTDSDNCDDCKSGSYDPANDHNPCINPLPEPRAVPSLVAAAIAVGALARRRRRR